MDRWTAERWVNDVHIESSRPTYDQAWRTDVLIQGVLIIRAILPHVGAGKAVGAGHGGTAERAAYRVEGRRRH
jgi:hypothetical protein